MTVMEKEGVYQHAFFNLGVMLARVNEINLTKNTIRGLLVRITKVFDDFDRLVLM